MGAGDPFGTPVSHSLVSGMGGIRTAGDLVARMQLHRKMRLPQAKASVAEKLRVSPVELSDEVVMREVREELDIGVITSVPGASKGLAAKARRCSRRRSSPRAALNSVLRGLHRPPFERESDQGGDNQGEAGSHEAGRALAGVHRRPGRSGCLRNRGLEAVVGQ